MNQCISQTTVINDKMFLPWLNSTLICWKIGSKTQNNDNKIQFNYKTNNLLMQLFMKHSLYSHCFFKQHLPKSDPKCHQVLAPEVVQSFSKVSLINTDTSQKWTLNISKTSFSIEKHLRAGIQPFKMTVMMIWEASFYHIFKYNSTIA